jgi:hypothetical protein
MRFARRVFVAAGIWGLAVVFPLYFLESTINERQPPTISHVEYYYGFTGITVVWQILFLVISRDPVKYRAIILIAILEKLAYGLAIPILFVASRVPGIVFITSLPDLIWATLFAIAYWKTPVIEA